jgi:hypothetical protein
MATDSIPFASDAETPLPAESLEVGVIFKKHLLFHLANFDVVILSRCFASNT